MAIAKEYERLRWACRRGMLELDLFLVPFFEKNYHELNEEEKITLEQLLGESDPNLFNWCMGTTTPSDKAYGELIEKIRAFKHLSDVNPLF